MPDAFSPGSLRPGGERAEAIFNGALQLPAGERADYLRRACGDEAGLRERVEELLKAHAASGDFSEESTTVPARKATSFTVPLTEKEGDRIGRYKLLQQIGEGGCGVVYMAEQEEPVRRRVALKVIKLGMDTKSVIARFEAERQALALMDHPNIAKVLDAGATENGRPFFVMELVRGIKITEYCDQNKLSTTERLKLLIQVCHAIQHAHQKGIIHRDIKPSNILVTLHDGVPVPKVIDFGIAKATQGRLVDQTLFTAFEQFIGTPAYMSPEQAEMSGMDIDTRCDVYALGVLLYELLTGKTPFDGKALMAAGLDKMRKTIREQEPEFPSTRLSGMLNAELMTEAAHHRTDAPKLIHLMRGDLDWIVMKTLEKDRTRRYETANALAMDIQRHLDNEPVMASPPSNVYRFQKLVRRNKTIFAAAGAVAATLIIGLCVSVYLLAREREARQRAVAAEQEQGRLRRRAEEDFQVGQKLTQVGLHLSRGEFEEAEKILYGMPPHPGSAGVLNVLGALHARMGHIPAAITAFTRATEVNPADYEAYPKLAPLLAQSDRDAYQRFVVRMLGQFGGGSGAIVSERIAKASLILPVAPANVGAIDKLVESAIGAGSTHEFWSYFQFAKGLAEFRKGHFTEATNWLQKVIADPRDRNRTACAYATVAMAQRQIKEDAKARASLAKGEELLDPVLSGAGWHDQILANLLVEEARGMISWKPRNKDGERPD